MEKFNLILNYIAAIIIASIILGSLVLTYNYVGSKEAPIQKIKIEYHGIKTDSINEINKIEIQQIDSLLHRIEIISNETLAKQINEIEKIEDENIFNKLYTAIIAIVIALAGFFGFKSISDIKNRSIKEARDQAKDVAKTEFKAIFTDEFKAKIHKKTEESFMKYNKDHIESFESRIATLESQEDTQDKPIEEPIVIVNNDVEPENLFDNE